MDENNLTKVVIPIVLGLVITDTLQSTFRPVFETGGSFSVPLIARLFVFSLMTFRFYLGSIGYVNTESKALAAGVRMTNFIFIFVTFCIFYTISLSVSRPEYFFSLIITLHGVDAVWFAVSFIISRNTTRTQQAGEIDPASLRWIMCFFFLLDVITIGAALFAYKVLFHFDFSDANAAGAQWVFMSVLTALSIVDFCVLSEFYFRFSDWRERNKIQNAVPAGG